MGSRDFLHTDAETPLFAVYTAAGAVCELSTNYQDILQAAHESFFPLEGSRRQADFQLRFWVDSSARSEPPWPRAHFRGLGHLIFGAFDSENSVLIDRSARRAVGRFSPGMGGDRNYWKRVIFSNLLTAFGGSIGVTEVHCGCVVRGEKGLLLSGSSGSGKSTLALALTRAGFAFLSDDRTWLSNCDGGLQAWGLPTLLKLRPDVVALFPELRRFQPSVLQDGRTAIAVDVETQLGLPRALRCEPHWLVFLERSGSPTNTLVRMPADEAAARLKCDLLPEPPGAAAAQLETIQRLAGRACWLLRYGGAPQEALQLLTRVIEFGFEAGPVVAKVSTGRKQGVIKHEDPFRRQTPTPHCSDLRVMGRSIRLETNSPMVLAETRRLFQCYESRSGNAEELSPPATVGAPEFRWRIVSEAQPATKPPWSCRSAFTDRELRYTSIGQYNFVAVDLEKREAVGFLTEGLAGDRPGFCNLFLDPLFCMTAEALGLTAVFSSCVGYGDRGLLVFGSPGSGKTTSSYFARELGLEFCADQATFLEVDGDSIRAWTGFLPALVREDLLRFLPHLRNVTRPLGYSDSIYLELDIATPGLNRPANVAPVGCVFLERSSAWPARLMPLEGSELAQRLERALLFREDPRFKAQRSAVLSALERLPASLIAFGDDPAEAAAFFPRLLAGAKAENALS
jgi:DNA polymerase III delta prime subunit